MSSDLQERAGAPAPPRPVLPSTEDPVVGGLVAAVGGRPGAHARTGDRRFWTPVRWLVLLTLLTSLLGFWQKSPCRVHPWAEQYQYTRLCYTDVFAFWGTERLGEGATPYLEHPVEHPPVVGAVMVVAAQVAELFPREERNRRFFDTTWALLTAAAVVVTVSTARLAGRRRVWDAALFAVAPGLLLQHSTSWDLVAVAFAMLGLLAWSRRAPVAAGVLLGLGTATKLYPVLFLVPLLALCWRAGKLRDGARTAAATVLTALLLVVPVYLVSPAFAEIGGAPTRVADSPLERFDEQGWAALAPHVEGPDPNAPGATVRGTNAVYRFVEVNQTRGADWESVWFALEKARTSGDSVRNDVLDLVVGDAEGPAEPSRVLNRTVGVGLLLVVLGVVVLALRAPRRPRLAALAFLTVAGACLTGKVFSPSYVLWLVPLALLARPRWRPFLVWQATEALLLPARLYYFIAVDQPGQGIGVGWFLGAVLLRDLALVGYCAYVVRDVLHPEGDVVRTDPLTGRPTGEDDPAGGVLDGAPGRPGVLGSRA